MDANVKKQLIDQSAHFGVGLVIVVILSFVFSIIASMLATFAIAYAREVYQRIERKDPWYECKSGCRMDLFFWFLGIVAGGIIAVVLL